MENGQLIIGQELAFGGIITDMKEFKGEPRVFAIADFIDLHIMVIHYDRFVGIMELNEKEMRYAAVGWSPSNELSDGTIQMFDVRGFEDKELAQEGITIFVDLIKDKTPQYTRVINGMWAPEIILSHIVDLWKLTYELSTSIIH